MNRSPVEGTLSKTRKSESRRKKNRGPANPGLDHTQRAELITIASAATAAATAAVFTATTAAARRALFARTRDVDREGATVNGFAVHGLDGLGGLFGRAHGDETETARTAGRPVHHQIGFEDRAVGCECILQVIFCGIEGKISNK